jgi:hypothetical protein
MERVGSTRITAHDPDLITTSCRIRVAESITFPDLALDEVLGN